MKVWILFGQRRERYENELLPEALEVADEGVMEENPAWLDEMFEENSKNPDLVALRWFEVDLFPDAQAKIRRALIGTPKLTGDLKTP